MSKKFKRVNRRKQLKHRPTISKSTAQRIHAKRRFAMRTGLILTHELRRELSTKILERKAKLVEKQSNRVSIYDVEHKIKGKSEVFRLVFDKMRKNIVTILDNLDESQDAEHQLELRTMENETDNT